PFQAGTSTREVRMSAAERSARHPCAAHPRAGVVLFDALVALFIMGVMAALIARGVRMQGRAAAEVSSRVQARRALRAAAAPLIGELRHAVLAGDAALSLHGDTLRIRTLVAGGSACATSDDRLALMAQPLDAPLASWRALPDSRDAMHLLLPEVSGDRCDRWGESGILGAAYSTAPP